mmetsp:Transcript_12483/g.32076  ORF Transcript_12483/g.32076 Transcript_12483/m.32076 type:complete len:308 (+) Transcript_12483:367-1290(+)
MSEERDDLVVDEEHAAVCRQVLEPVRVDAVLVLHLRAPCDGCQLGDAGDRVSVRILMRPRLQELQAVLVCTDDVQRLRGNRHRLADPEVGKSEVRARGWVLDPPLVGELARHVAAVALRELEDCGLVVSRVESNDEASALILRLTVDHLALEPQHLASERHQLRQVYLRSLGHDVLAAQDRVLRIADAVVRRRRKRPVVQWLLGDVDAVRPLVVAQIVLIELLREVIAVVKHHLAAPHVDVPADTEVLRQVEVGIGREHARVGIDSVCLLHRPPLHEHGVVVTPRVAAVSLVDLHGVVSEVVVDDEV